MGKWYGQVGLRYEDTQYTGHQLGNPEKPDSVFVRHISIITYEQGVIVVNTIRDTMENYDDRQF